MTTGTRLYGDLADWWPLMSAPADYAEEAGLLAGVLRAACAGPARTLLELGSGGGNNASHLKGELGLDHYEGRSFVGWHHHVSVVLACQALLVAELARSFPPSAAGANRHRPLRHAA